MITPDRSGIVVGIDVGGSKKGYQAVAFSDGQYWRQFASDDPARVVDWCRAINALAVAIDAPCRWRSAEKARQAERDLAKAGISCFITPAREQATSNSFYQWMLNGEKLYRAIEPDYPLYNGRSNTPPICFETFPQAVACALAAVIVSAKKKGTIRRALLKQAGVNIEELTNIDLVDAALCALTAHYFLVTCIEKYGDDVEGFIIVPAAK